MKVTVLQENLVKAVQAVSRMTITGGQLPILSHIKLMSKKDGLFLTASNLELSVIYKLGAKIEKNGEVAIPARLFGEYVSSLSSGKVLLSQSGDKLLLESKGNTATLQGMSAVDFPDVPTKRKKNLFSSGQELIEAVTQVGFAAATEESRPVLSGVQLKKEDSMLRIVATDGYRLSIKRIKVAIAEMDGSCIVPAKTLNEVVQIMKSNDPEEIKVGLSEEGGQIIFDMGDVVLVSRLIEGDFPPFEHILPKGGDTKVTLDREEILGAVKTAALFARESANIVRWKLDRRMVTISANSPQVGNNSAVIETQVSGKGGEIAFNSRYLLDLLSAVGVNKSKGIKFEMSEPLSPGLFMIEGDASFEHVIMPVRVQDKT